MSAPCACITLQSKPALLLGLPGSKMVLHLCTTTLLLAKHSNTAAARGLCPGFHCAGRWSRLASNSLLLPACKECIPIVRDVRFAGHAAQLETNELLAADVGRHGVPELRQQTFKLMLEVKI